jgi:hypothetical protein
MKVMTMVISIIIVSTYAGTPKYVMYGQGSGLSKSAQSGQEVRFTLSQNKQSNDVTAKVREVRLGSQVFSIPLQDDFNASEGVPFFVVEFPGEDSVNKVIYALKATSGTAGTSFHYFIKQSSGMFSYSGMHPEIIFDNELKQFISMEKDGGTIHLTTWSLSSGTFKAVKSEVMK